jgi:hypothetical protein
MVEGFLSEFSIEPAGAQIYEHEMVIRAP